MTPETFFENFDLLADAPNGVPQLRALILQLAVQGKLVPQDPSDEPASVLLERIREEKAQLVAKGKLKQEKSLPIADDEEPFELPDGWEWAYFCDVATIASNLVQPLPFSDFPHIAPDNIEKQTGRLLAYRTVREDDVRSGKHHFFSGQILYSKIRPNLSKATIVDFEGLCSADMYPVNSLIDSKYLLKYILSATFLSMAVKSDTRVAMPKINQDELNKILVAVPPLGEQRRIVAKVDQLMALCDELESRQQQRRAARTYLNDTALDQLLAAREPDEFAAHWQRLRDNFDLLYDTPETIGKLRQSILQLAVQGKLVPQDPDDEPASALLEQIRAEKARLVAEGKLKKEKPLPLIGEDEKPFELPNGWEWIKLATISDVGTGSTPLTTNRDYYQNGNIPWITSAATTYDYIASADTYITQAAVSDFRLRIYPPQTLIIALYGQGKTRGQISELCVAAAVNQACAAIQLIDPDDEHRSYVKYYFEMQYDELRSLAAGAAQPNLNVGKIKEALIPLPPLAEQRRIVAKVEQLMALCDELDAQLKDAQARSAALLEVVVRQVLADGVTAV